MSIAYISGTLTTAQPCSLPQFSQPFPGVAVDYMFTQDWSCRGEDYVEETLNTAHPVYTEFFLVAEGEKRDMGVGMVRWTRTYAKVPATHSQPSTSTYSFVGYYTGGNAYAVGRNRTPSTAAARVQFDYFKLNSNGTITDADGTVVYAGLAGIPSVAFVPIIQATDYYGLDLTTTEGGNIGVVQMQIFSNHIGYFAQGVYPVPGWLPTPNPSGYWPAPNLDAYPTRDAYEYWIAYNRAVQLGLSLPTVPANMDFATPAAAQLADYYTDTYTAPVGGNPGQTLFELVAQASIIRRWAGNIIERETVFILPQ